MKSKQVRIVIKILCVLLIPFFLFIYYKNHSAIDIREVDKYFQLVREIQNGKSLKDITSQFNLPVVRSDYIFVTFYYKNKTRGCFGTLTTSTFFTNNIVQDFFKATHLTMSDERFIKDEQITDYSKQDTLISFLNKDGEILDIKNDFDKKYIRGLHSIEIKNGKKSAIYLPYVQFESHWNNKQTLVNLCKKASMKSNCYLDSNSKIILYTTNTYLKDKSGKISEYYKLISYKDLNITKQMLEDNVGNALAWLDKNKIKNGFVYGYTITKVATTYNDKFNYVRQFATLRAYEESCILLKKDCLLTNQDYFKNVNDFYLSKSVVSGNSIELIENDSRNVAFNAMYILFLVDSNIENKQELISKLSNSIISRIMEDGTVMGTTSSEPKAQNIYEGEVYLSLIEAYKITKNPVYLNYFEKGIPHLTKIANNKDNIYLHWISQAMYEYYLIKKDADIAQEIYDINDFFISKYQKVDSTNKYEFGAFSKETPSFETAFVLESLTDAYKLAVLRNDIWRQIFYKNSIKNSVRFMSQLWLDESNSYYFTNAEMVKGAMMNGVSSNMIREDFVGHALTALKKILETDIYR